MQRNFNPSIAFGLIGSALKEQGSGPGNPGIIVAI